MEARVFFYRHRELLLYSSLLAVLLFLLKWLELKFMIANNAIEIYTGIIATIFTVLGIWLAMMLARPKIKTVTIEKHIFNNQSAAFAYNQVEIDRLNLSRREMEVLQLMASGMSNLEIAAKLFVSLNTIKTHTAKVFQRMHVKRRTQAVEKARSLGIIN